MKIFTLVVCFTLFVSSLDKALAAPLWDNSAYKGDDYLLGTIHIGDQRLQRLPDSIIEAIDNVDVVVLETDLRSVTQLEQQQVVMQLGFLPAGVSLKDMVSPEVYSRVRQYLMVNGVAIENMHQFKPWMLALTMVQMSYAKQGFDAARGVDQQVLAYAVEKGKKIIGLESYKEQMGFFNLLFEQNPHLTADDLLLDTLNELEQYADLPDVMIRAWIEGDMSKFESIYKKTLDTNEFDRAAEKILLSERNLNWAPKLEKLFKNNSVLVAVGTLHFTGPNDLKRLLNVPFSR